MIKISKKQLFFSLVLVVLFVLLGKKILFLISGLVLIYLVSCVLTFSIIIFTYDNKKDEIMYSELLCHIGGSIIDILKGPYGTYLVVKKKWF